MFKFIIKLLGGYTKKEMCAKDKELQSITYKLWFLRNSVSEANTWLIGYSDSKIVSEWIDQRYIVHFESTLNEIVKTKYGHLSIGEFRTKLVEIEKESRE